MQEFPEKYVFKYPWREYQARVLRELDGHFDDQKLNVVAAPCQAPFFVDTLSKIEA